MDECLYWDGGNMTKEFEIKNNEFVPFDNNVDYCVGTGRMGLALTKEYMEQLKEVQAEIGFKYIRGHGLFSDDMAIFQKIKYENGEENIEYNFTYLDLVMDNYMSVNIKPFLELGFMPYKLASGDQTVFYWKGNTTPPKSYEDWNNLVVATLKHLMDRYGAEEVVTWPIEVWNEPNLPGFWKDADMDEYLVLFENTINAIKKLDSRFKVGGPAICGVEDKKHIKFFMDFVHNKKVPVDFITRHHYTSEQPVRSGHYSMVELRPIDEAFETLKDSRDIIDSYPEFKGMDMHITEFNTSYVPNAPIHDTNQNAAYVAAMLAKFPENCASYSYWTFGDVFEEWGVPFTPFHGGFGMLANGCIRKPTFYSFKFFKDLKGKCVLKNENMVICKDDKGNYSGVLFNANVKREGEMLEANIKCFTENEDYVLITKTVDENTCNPLKVWHDLGEPSSLSKEDKNILKSADKPLIKTQRITAHDNHVNVKIDVELFGLVYFELKKSELTPDTGYNYAEIVK